MVLCALINEPPYLFPTLLQATSPYTPKLWSCCESRACIFRSQILKHPSHQICLHQILQMSCRSHYKIPIEATPSFTTSFMWNVKVSYILVLNNIIIVSLLHVSSCLSWTRRWLSRVAMRRVMLAVDDRQGCSGTLLPLKTLLPSDSEPSLWPSPQLQHGDFPERIDNKDKGQCELRISLKHMILS